LPPAHLTRCPLLPAAFSDPFNLLPKDPDDNIKLPSLEVTAKKLGISLTSQEANDELVCADADRDRMVDFFDFLDIITDKECFAHTTSPGKNDSDSFDSVNARGILLLKVFLKLAELAAVPQRTLFRIISYYQQKLRDCTGQKVRVDGDSLKRCRKKPQKTQKEPVYPMSAFVSAAHVSARNKRDTAAYMEHLKGKVCPLSPPLCSPYAQVPIFPLISKQHTTTRAKPKRGLQKVARQRNEPTTSFESHFFRKRNRVQEAAALKPPAHRRKQRHFPDINTERPNTPRHLTTNSPGKTQVSKAQVAKRYRHSPALRQRRSPLKLCRKISRGQIGLQTGSEHFHHTSHPYSWLWNTHHELATTAAPHRRDHQRRPARQETARDARQRQCL
ncbi:EFCB3 protein, partial [Grus americana]|nr:EFCB3 protein [Grus americana]